MTTLNDQITVGPIYKKSSDQLTLTISFVTALSRANTTISGLSSVTSIEVTGVTDDNAGTITITNPVLLGVDFLIGTPEITIPANMAVQFRVDGGIDGESYVVEIVLTLANGSTVSRNVLVTIADY